jgi:hypothetical protein
MGPQSRTVERIIAELAFAANGVVSREELLAAGIAPHVVRDRIRNGLLIREYPGVYRVGHRAPSPLATYSAAVKAGGEGAVLAGFAAAWLLGLIRGDAPPPEVITCTPRTLQGVLTRCCKRMSPRETSELHGIRVTTVPRTLVDLAPRLEADQLARVFHEAMVRYDTKPEQVEPLLRGRTSAAKLRAVMYGETPVHLSKVEARLYEELRAAGLRLPETNKRVGNRYLDCRWPGLTVEIDSYRYHGSRHAWERDRVRERVARARRDDFRTFTWGDVFERPGAMLAELREALTALGLV